MFIYDAAMRYRDEGVPLLILAGKEYGSGSSRDWAAKGTALLGVRAVIAETYERIHRSNLVGMGVLPLQFLDGQNAASLGLTGRESFTLTGLADLQPRQVVTVVARSGRRDRAPVPGDRPAGRPDRGRVPAPGRDPARGPAAARRELTRFADLPDNAKPPAAAGGFDACGPSATRGGDRAARWCLSGFDAMTAAGCDARPDTKNDAGPDRSRVVGSCVVVGDTGLEPVTSRM